MPFITRSRHHPNVVGYLQQTTRAGFNYMTPTFVAVDGSNLSVQELKLDSTVVSGQANIQILDENGVTPDAYDWFTRDGAAAQWADKDKSAKLILPEGMDGAWLEKKVYGSGQKKVTYYEILDRTLNPGDSVQIWTYEGSKTMTTAGAVPNDDVITPSVAGFNYVGNPFPVAINVQDVKLDTTVVSGQANIQILDENGVTPDAYDWFTREGAAAQWADKDKSAKLILPDGMDGAWLVKKVYGSGQKKVTYYEILDLTLNPGDGIQVWTYEAGKNIAATCPAACK